MPDRRENNKNLRFFLLLRETDIFFKRQLPIAEEQKPDL